MLIHFCRCHLQRIWVCWYSSMIIMERTNFFVKFLVVVNSFTLKKILNQHTTIFIGVFFCDDFLPLYSFSQPTSGLLIWWNFSKNKKIVQFCWINFISQTSNVRYRIHTHKKNEKKRLNFLLHYCFPTKIPLTPFQKTHWMSPKKKITSTDIVG